MRSDFTVLLAETKEFCSRHNLLQQYFSAKRVRRRGKESDELSNYKIGENPTAKYKRETSTLKHDFLRIKPSL